jgi:hypothetical protein
MGERCGVAGLEEGNCPTGVIGIDCGAGPRGIDSGRGGTGGSLGWERLDSFLERNPETRDGGRGACDCAVDGRGTGAGTSVAMLAGRGAALGMITPGRRSSSRLNLGGRWSGNSWIGKPGIHVEGCGAAGGGTSNQSPAGPLEDAAEAGRLPGRARDESEREARRAGRSPSVLVLKRLLASLIMLRGGPGLAVASSSRNSFEAGGTAIVCAQLTWARARPRRSRKLSMGACCSADELETLILPLECELLRTGRIRGLSSKPTCLRSGDEMRTLLLWWRSIGRGSPPLPPLLPLDGVRMPYSVCGRRGVTYPPGREVEAWVAGGVRGSANSTLGRIRRCGDGGDPAIPGRQICLLTVYSAPPTTTVRGYAPSHLAPPSRPTAKRSRSCARYAAGTVALSRPPAAHTRLRTH